MMDEKLYRETFSQLRASDKAKEEVFQMMNQNGKHKRFSKILRTAAMAAVMTLALAMTAGAVDLATGGFLLENLREVWSNGYETRYVANDAEGNEYIFSVMENATVYLENGRLVCDVLDKKMDITDEMEENGEYHYETSAGDLDISVTVTGTVDDWTMSQEINNGEVIYHSTLNSDNEATIGGEDIESTPYEVREPDPEEGDYAVSSTVTTATEAEVK